ncbi:MAG: hypothetical protein JWR00_286 [Rubritepida sp.]|nr:hypothetical protein [Rubritepida sp.]
MSNHQRLNGWKTAAARHSSAVVLQYGYHSFLRSIAGQLAKLDPRDWPDLLPDGTAPHDRERMLQMAMSALAQSPRNFDAARDAFVRSVRRDPDALWALFEPYRREAIQAILAEANRKMRDSAPVHARPASEPHVPAVAALAKVAMASLLETFKIAGRPLGDVTVEEARRWSKRRKRDALFVEMLTDNLPAHDVIRSRRTAEDARRIFEEAANA